MVPSQARALPGEVVHWAAPHPRIGQDVHSHHVAPARTLLDPMAGDGLDAALDGRDAPERIVLTCRHHLRGTREVVARFDCEVLCAESGLHEFEDADVEVRGFEWGAEVAPGITAHEAGAICPDDAVLHIDHGPGYLAFGDGVIRWDGRLAFVPDFLMDDPEQVKSAMVAALEPLLDLRFDGLLLAHGEPTAAGGRAELEEFAASPAQAEFGAPS